MLLQWIPFCEFSYLRPESSSKGLPERTEHTVRHAATLFSTMLLEALCTTHVTHSHNTCDTCFILPAQVVYLVDAWSLATHNDEADTQLQV